MGCTVLGPGMLGPALALMLDVPGVGLLCSTEEYAVLWALVSDAY